MYKQMTYRSRCNVLVASVLLAGGLLSLPAQAQFEDPTRPPNFSELASNAAQDSSAPAWQLSSILVSPQRSIAIINGKTVKQGDRIGNARVLKIQTTGVILRTGEETFTVKLLPEKMKTTREE